MTMSEPQPTAERSQAACLLLLHRRGRTQTTKNLALWGETEGQCSTARCQPPTCCLHLEIKGRDLICHILHPEPNDSHNSKRILFHLILDILIIWETKVKTAYKTHSHQQNTPTTKVSISTTTVQICVSNIKVSTPYLGRPFTKRHVRPHSLTIPV